MGPLNIFDFFFVGLSKKYEHLKFTVYTFMFKLDVEYESEQCEQPMILKTVLMEWTAVYGRVVR